MTEFAALTCLQISPRHPDCRHKRAMSLNNQYKALRLASEMKTLDGQLQCGPRGDRGHSCVMTSSVTREHIQGLCLQGQLDQALNMLVCLDSVPSVDIYTCLLKACTRRKALVQANRVHAHLAKHGLESTRFLGEYVVSTLVKCGGLEDALQVFYRLHQRTVFSWTAVISGYTMSGQGQEALRMYWVMQDQGVQPNTYTFVSLLKGTNGIANLTDGKRIHAEVLKYSCETDLFVGTSLVDMYARCGSVVDARSVFNRLSCRDVVTWNGMLVAYVQHGQAEQALQLYEEMRGEGVGPDVWSLVTALQACAMLASKEDLEVNERLVCLENGRAIHADILTKGYDSDVCVGSSLVTMYGKCGSIENAQSAFDALSEQDLVSWNAMLAAYAQQGLGDQALELYERMREEDVSPDGRTYVSAFQACCMLVERKGDAMQGRTTKVKSLGKGKAIHADAQKKGYLSDVFVGNSLITMYGKCGSLLDAQDVFDNLIPRDLVSWNAMLEAYVEQGQAEKALQLYRQMQQECISVDEITLMCILQACSNTGGLHLCRQIHQFLVSTENELSPLLGNTLIHAYGKCASMADAQTVFEALLQRSVVSWNALLAGYAREGNIMASLQCYEKMRLGGMKPSGVTFLSILSACSHAGLVEKGVQYFESMSKEHGLVPGIEHYTSMVDLLGRAGYFTMAEGLLRTMPMQPDLAMCLCLLGGCRKHGRLALGKQAFDCAVHLHPQNASAYFLMSSIYADAGLWDLAKEVNELQETVGAWKEPSQSWIEHQQEMVTFGVGDCKHLHQDPVYELLRKVNAEAKARTSSLCGLS